MAAIQIFFCPAFFAPPHKVGNIDFGKGESMSLAQGSIKNQKAKFLTCAENAGHSLATWTLQPLQTGGCMPLLGTLLPWEAKRQVLFAQACSQDMLSQMPLICDD